MRHVPRPTLHHLSGPTNPVLGPLAKVLTTSVQVRGELEMDRYARTGTKARLPEWLSRYPH